MQFCIRDDDTNYFTNPDELELAYQDFWRYGPISISITPFQKGCKTKAVPAKYQLTGEIYPIDENIELVNYLRKKLRQGHIEIMLHGYHHEDIDGNPEFVKGRNLREKIDNGKLYLEQLFKTQIQVFVPPHNTISREGLRAVVSAGLQLGILAGIRYTWPLFSSHSWRNWWRIRRWGQYYPFVVNMGDHYELQGNSVTPSSNLQDLITNMKIAARSNGVFCLATHYWEFGSLGYQVNPVSVRQQVEELVRMAQAYEYTQWVSLGYSLISGR